MLKSFQLTQNRKGQRLHTTSCNRSQTVKTMENDDGNMFMGNRGPTGNNNNNNLGWDILELNPTTSRSDWGSNNETNSLNFYTSGRTETTSSSSEANALMFLPNQHSLYTGDGSHMNPPDPHLVCLKLGKRHYFEDTTDLTDSNMFINGKKGKPLYNNINNTDGGVGASSSTASMAVPRCQVEGCNVALVNAKDYHRRHKVCEMHSKTPKVVVLGLEQRFCQQCSRFHVVSEFDDSKRSCRRRLAGHNERRRKLSHDSASRTSAQGNKLMTGSIPYLSSPTGPALSLLSSKTDAWIPPSDVSTRSSAALHDLIAEYRSAIIARPVDCHLHHHAMEDLGDLQQGSSSIAVQHHSSLPCFPDQTSAQVTLDLMQVSSSAFGMLSVRGETKEDVEECSELWNSLQGTHG